MKGNSKGKFVRSVSATHPFEKFLDPRPPVEINLPLHIKPQVRLPEDVEEKLYNPSPDLKLTWQNKITLALSRGELPEGITIDEIISTVRGKGRNL